MKGGHYGVPHAFRIKGQHAGNNTGLSGVDQSRLSKCVFTLKTCDFASMPAQQLLKERHRPSPQLFFEMEQTGVWNMLSEERTATQDNICYRKIFSQQVGCELLNISGSWNLYIALEKIYGVCILRCLHCLIPLQLPLLQCHSDPGDLAWIEHLCCRCRDQSPCKESQTITSTGSKARSRSGLQNSKLQRPGITFYGRMWDLMWFTTSHVHTECNEYLSFWLAEMRPIATSMPVSWLLKKWK